MQCTINKQNKQDVISFLVRKMRLSRILKLVRHAAKQKQIRQSVVQNDRKSIPFSHATMFLQANLPALQTMGYNIF